VLSGICHCVELTVPPEFYRMWCVGVRSWSLENKANLAH